MKAKKRFGQHFLTDEKTLAAIIKESSPQKGDCFLEVGPGRGALTEHLIKSGVQLTAVEIDRDCAALLRDKFAKHTENFSLVEGDMLKIDFPPPRPSPASGRGRKTRLIGNLPYNISTPLLLRLCHHHGDFPDAHFMLQKEVAMRLCAAPGDSDYGRLTVTVRMLFAAEMLFAVSPRCFTPPPKVESAFVRMTPLSDVTPPPPLFEKVLAAAFQSRRKLLRNALRAFEVDWRGADVDGDARPQELSPADYAKLSANAVEK